VVEVPGPEHVSATKLGLQDYDILDLFVDGPVENLCKRSFFSPVHIGGLAQRVVVPR
jgi:hypothetical protein